MFKKTLFIFALSLFSFLAIGSLSSQKVLAALTPPYGCPGSGFAGPPSPGVSCTDESTWPDHASDDTEVEGSGQKVLDYLQTGINLVTALAGLAITAAFIMGGIQYSTSGGNPQAAASAKKRIGNAVLALLALVFLYTFLQWLVPGGIF